MFENCKFSEILANPQTRLALFGAFLGKMPLA